MPEVDSNTKLMLHLNGADEATTTVDASDSNHTINFNATAQLDTAYKKWGTTSLLVDGDSDYLDIDDSVDWDIVASNSTNRTVDLQVRHTDHVDTETYIQHYEGSFNYWNITHTHGDGLRWLVAGSEITNFNTGYGGEIEDTNWHHIAMCKVGNKYGLYKDGDQIGYVTDNAVVDHTGSLIIGAFGGASFFFDGSIDEVRINHNNVFGADPQADLSNTITAPTKEYSKYDDIGIRVRASSGTIKIGALALVGTHKLRIRKGATTYGIPLVATTDEDASGLRIYDGSTAKALPKTS